MQSGAISSTAAHSALPASAAQCNGCAPSRLAPSVRCGARCSSLRRHVGQRAAQLRCAAVALSVFWTACAAAPARRRASLHSQSRPPPCPCSAAMSSAGRPSPARWLMNAEAGCRWSRFESNKLMHPGLPCAAAAWSQLQFRAARPSGRSAGGGDAAKGGGPKAFSSALGSSATSAMRASGGRRSHASGGSGREVGGGGSPRAAVNAIWPGVNSPSISNPTCCVNVNTTDATTGATALLLPARYVFFLMTNRTCGENGTVRGSRRP